MSRIQLVLLAGLASAATASAATVGVNNSSATWLGFMNVFNLDNSPAFSSGWGPNDLNSTFNDGAGTLTLSPNTIGDPDPFWYIGGGGPGHAGNKLMEANLYQETTDVYNGQTLHFTGLVLSNTFTSAHVSKIFIRDFAPDYSSFNEASIPLVPGAFDVSLATDPGFGRHVQWGFQTKGVNVWFTDIAPFGNAVIATPAPGSIALIGLGGLVAGRRRR